MQAPEHNQLCACTMPDNKIKMGWYNAKRREWENTARDKTWSLVKAWDSCGEPEPRIEQRLLSDTNARDGATEVVSLHHCPTGLLITKQKV